MIQNSSPACITKMKHRIVVADDDQDILDALKLMLETYDYDVDIVQNPSQLTKITQFQPGLVLLDVRMSGIDGRDICKSLKRNNETKDIPVILFSASNDIEKCFQEVGANDFIEKPFNIPELLKKIENQLIN